MPILIPDKLTRLSPDDAARFLAQGYKEVTGKAPSVSILKLIIAQSALESGNWGLPPGKMHNYNYGNEKSSGSDAYSQIYQIGDDPTDAGAHYAAFLTPQDGATHYVHTLTKRDHWRAGLQSGKAEVFIRALSTPPVYFTADPARYLVTMTRLIDQYSDLAKKYGNSLLGIVVGFLLAGASGTSIYLLLRK